MAQQAGSGLVDLENTPWLASFLERFAQAAYDVGAAAENEACEQVVNAYAPPGLKTVLTAVAADIRARRKV
jgi:hypothetical protein